MVVRVRMGKIVKKCTNVKSSPFLRGRCQLAGSGGVQHNKIYIKKIILELLIANVVKLIYIIYLKNLYIIFLNVHCYSSPLSLRDVSPQGGERFLLVFIFIAPHCHCVTFPLKEGKDCG